MKTIRLFLITGCLFCFSYPGINAQQTPSVLLKKETPGSVTLKIGMATSGNIQVDWGDGNPVTALAGTTESTLDIPGTVTGTNIIKLYGAITTVTVADASLTAVDVSNAPLLRKLVVPRNKIKEVDLTYNPVVYYVSVYSNQQDACALDDLFRSLPVVTSGTIVIYSNPGASTSTTSIATAKGWTIGSGTTGNGTGCEITSELAVYAENDEETDAKNEDPGFLNLSEGDFRLTALSPAIDAGDNTLFPAGIAVDLSGNPRISNAFIDLGCYEFSPTTITYNQIRHREAVEIFPNPVSEQLNVKVQPDMHTLELKDLTGKTVISQPNTSGEGEYIAIDVSRLAAGIYILATGVSAHKIIVRGK
ncbi:MAG: T9SS type A sorting domain-containing protein [Dysgonamonadaceae bacterium]|jgi:hypothetical protein|nr:T9SS type A sorting domain-containing protein [Dysgonamonadaceae bacterium]